MVINVSKIVLTSCEKKLFKWLRKPFQIWDWRLRICKIYSNIKRSILETEFFFSLLLEWAYTVNNKNMVLLYRIVQVGAVHKLCHLGRGEGGCPKDDLLNRPYLIKKPTRGEGVKNRRFWDDIVYGRPPKYSKSKTEVE